MQRRHFGVLLLGAVLFVGCAKSDAPAKPAELKRLTIDEVATKLAAKDGKTFIYDANTKDSWVKGHVPSATWIDDEDVKVEQLAPDRSALLVFYCHDEA
ncbi:hypothetical protein BH11MYX1_BH11MYX1_33960 [soil metagenome]